MKFPPRLVDGLLEQVAADVPEGLDLEPFWDGMYGWRVGEYRIPDPEFTSRTSADFSKRAAIVEKYFRDVQDYWFHVYKPAPGDVFADVGAGRGEDTFVFSRAVGGSGLVLAIEPHPVSFFALQKLCEWNRLSNVRCVQRAATSARQSLEIETMAVWESNFVRSGEKSETSFSIEGEPFDEIAAREGIGAISFLKMNIEGAEREALPGCRKALEQTQSVCVAAHDFRAERGEGEAFRTLGMVRQFLSEAGFELTTRDEDPRYYVPLHVHGVRR
jgi:FkbM family methyltransferase